MATWGPSCLDSVAMLQWLTGRYVNSQLSCSPASESFNKHTRGTRVKVGAAIKHCGKPGDRWPEKFCNFPLFLNFYDFIVTAGLFWDLVSQFKPVWLCGYFETLTPIYWIAFYTKRHHTDSRLAQMPCYPSSLACITHPLCDNVLKERT